MDAVFSVLVVGCITIWVWGNCSKQNYIIPRSIFRTSVRILKIKARQ